MASQTSICNQALAKLGANPIINIDQESTEAQLCKTFYTDVLQAVLEEYPWTFATKRYELPKSAETPPPPFAAQYLIPSNILAIVQASSNPDFTRINPTEWQVENGYIVSDSGTMYIKAIIDVTDTRMFSAKFIRAFVSRMAAELSLPITQSREMHRQLMEEYGILLDRAISADGQQGRSRKYRSMQLIMVRTAGTSYAGPTV